MKATDLRDILYPFAKVYGWKLSVEENGKNYRVYASKNQNIVILDADQCQRTKMVHCQRLGRDEVHDVHLVDLPGKLARALDAPTKGS